MREQPRILGIDPGQRRVGLAVSDPLGITAQGLETFDRRSGDILDHIASLAREWEIGSIVVGHPLSMSGRPSVSSEAARAFADEVARRLGVPVTLWDERLSSVEAKRVLAGTGASRRKGTVDRVAAVLILQGYLDSRDKGGAA